MKDNKVYNNNEILDFIKYSKLEAGDVFETPPIILKVDDSIIGTLGNFSSSTGKAKSRKTFHSAVLAASAISNRNVLNYTATLPPNKNKVVFIDTEQSKYHCKKVYDRILYLSGYSNINPPENFEFFALRPYSPELRIAIIETIIKQSEEIGLVIIDGIRDLAYDINSSHEATEVITKLMKWTEKQNIHIHTVLHQNKTDNNSRGHLGTELNNKSETVLKITVPENNKEISIIESEFIRDKDFEPFAFSIDDDGIPVLEEDFVPEETSNNKGLNPNEIDISTHKNDILSIVFKNENRLSYSETWKAIKEVYSKFGKMGNNKAKDWLSWYQNQGLIQKNDKLYYLNNDTKPV